MPSPLPIIPTRYHKFDSAQPANYCTVKQVLALLRGQSLAKFASTDGTFDAWYEELRDTVIPEVTADVYKAMRTPMDWCRTIYITDGSAGDAISLPHRYIYDVNLCYMRVLPSLPFYAFQRIRNVDGTEFARILGVEPAQQPAEILPPNPLTAEYSSSLVYTGIEDADLFVDTRARELRIPPRVLVAPVGLPMSQFNFIAGTLNIEVHYRFGFAPTAYEDGSPLQFDGTTGMVLDPKPGGDNPSIPIDWSSGMPRGFTTKVARLVKNRVLRQKWMGIAEGLSSISVDGASESYTNPTTLDAEDASLLSEIAAYGIPIII